MELIKEALTFDDVLLVPRYSGVLPSETNLNIFLGNNLKLKIPFLLEINLLIFLLPKKWG